MNCSLCNKPIKGYLPEFNHLQIDDSHAADICGSCIDKFMKWQGSLIAKLFPTKAMKNMYAGKE